MKIFRKDSDYAVRILLFLAMRDGTDFVSTTFLAHELGLPLNYLRRIGTTLIRARILEAREGAGGGVRSARKPNSITLLELINLFQGKVELSDCTFREKLCVNRGTCLLRRRILGIEEKIAKEFDAISIQDLIDDLTRSEN